MQNEGSFSGSTFFCPSKPPPVIKSADGKSSAGSKVLIFSVERDTRLLLGTFLQMWNYQTAESDCLEKSLTIVHNEQPKLILLDTILSFEASLEVIRRIRQNKFCKKIPIIAISGFSQPAFRSFALAIGANDFFVKPLDFDSLENRLKRNVERYIAETY